LGVDHRSDDGIGNSAKSALYTVIGAGTPAFWHHIPLASDVAPVDQYAETDT
jgi:hypothetical protein